MTHQTSSSELAQAVDEAKSRSDQGGAPLGKRQDREILDATAVPTDAAFRTFKRLLDSYGLRYALYSLLRLTDYRYISIFRLENGVARSVAHVDREDLAATTTADTPEVETYCCYVRSAEGPFALVDSAIDARVDGHAKQQELRAYCGVPIVSPEGELLGTLCHYDPQPRDPAQLDTELLVQVSSEIARSGLLNGKA